MISTAFVPASAANTCAPAAAGGEWRSYSHDLSNSRNQPDEHTIGVTQVPNLKAKWVFDSSSTATAGSFNTTPAVADGCIFLDGGTAVYALNADTGQLVWETNLAGAAGSPFVTDGKVFVNISASPGGAAALNESDGSILWQTIWGDPYPGADAESSPAVFNGMVLSTLSLAGAELSTTRAARGQYALLNESTGALLVKGYSISNTDFNNGAWGGGLWSTPAVDTASGYAYEGTGNPYGVENPHTDAIIKIDVDPTRSTFGQIVASYSGTPDTYVPIGPRPGCSTLTQTGAPNIATCEFDDLDFGASPQLFTDSSGKQVVGDLQKSGVYHVADTATMSEAWSTIVGLPAQPEAIFLGAASTASFDGSKIVVASSYPGIVQSLDRDHGAVGWRSPILSVAQYEPVTTANGVAYTVDGLGNLHAIDTSSGSSLLFRPLTLDIGQNVAVNALGGDGVAVARNTVYVPIEGFLVAYQ
ncbi:MAG: outer membrane protein assembly factor BamB family protein [Actinomycetota bacterium]